MASNSSDEGIVNGTVDMLRPLLFNLDGWAGLDWLAIMEPEYRLSGASYAAYRVLRLVRAEGSATQTRTIGNLETQQLPGERVLISFYAEPRPGDRPFDDDDRAAFQVFRQALIARFMQLGFVEAPAPPPMDKAPFGFVPKTPEV